MFSSYLGDKVCHPFVYGWSRSIQQNKTHVVLKILMGLFTRLLDIQTSKMHRIRKSIVQYMTVIPHNKSVKE